MIVILCLSTCSNVNNLSDICIQEIRNFNSTKKCFNFKDVLYVL